MNILRGFVSFVSAISCLISFVVTPTSAAHYASNTADKRLSYKSFSSLYTKSPLIAPQNPKACSVIIVKNINTGSAYCSIQEANDASTTLNGHVIIISAGTYTTQTSTITKSLAIIGDGAGVTLDGLNASRVMTASGITITLQNITMTNGNGNGDSTFWQNKYGGCLYSRGDTTLINAGFINCVSGMRGGGVFIDANATISSSLFISNSAFYGGGAYISKNALINSSQFINNLGLFTGGGVAVENNAIISFSRLVSNSAFYANGGGVWVKNAIISSTQFINNSASGAGGGLNVTDSSFITSSRFINNSAANSGGGASSLDANITKSQFIDNSAHFAGGGAYINRNATISSSLFTNNSVNYGNGGGLYIFQGLGLIVNSLFSRNSASTGLGNAIFDCYPYTICHTLEIIYTTIASPSQATGAAIYAGNNSNGDGIVNIRNTILVNHQVGITGTGIINEDYNYFDGNGIDISNSNIVSSGLHHPTGPQAFIDPSADDYRLDFNNPSINSGVDLGVTNDYFDNTRPQGSAVDIGYHELTIVPTAIELAEFYVTTTSAAKCGNPSGADCVSISWQTVHENDMAGFVLLRGSASSMPADASVVSGFIQSQSSSGTSYSWQDTSTQPDQTYAYWLREIEINGVMREFGPVLISVNGAVK